MARDKQPVDYPLGLGPADDPSRRAPEDFYHLVRRVDACHGRQSRTGFSIRPREERLRFRQIPHLFFAPATVGPVEAREDAENGRDFAEVMVYFMGLLGANGPMPSVISDVIIARAKGVPHPDLDEDRGGESAFRADTGPAAFIDLFNHRFISFFYRAAVAANKAVDFDRPGESRFHRFIGSFIGLGSPPVQNRMDLPDAAALYFAGHYGCGSRHAEGLCAMATDFTGTPATIRENIGHWVGIPSTNHTRLGANAVAGRLGEGTVLGARFWDRTMKFRLVLGPMTWRRFQSFLPGGPLVKALTSMVLLYLDRELICEINPVLAKEEVPPCVLGRGSRLGFSSWLQSVPFAEDADNLKITIIP